MEKCDRAGLSWNSKRKGKGRARKWKTKKCGSVYKQARSALAGTSKQERETTCCGCQQSKNSYASWAEMRCRALIYTRLVRDRWEKEHFSSAWWLYFFVSNFATLAVNENGGDFLTVRADAECAHSVQCYLANPRIEFPWAGVLFHVQLKQLGNGRRLVKKPINKNSH